MCSSDLSVLLNVLRCVLWPRIWPVMVNVSCELELEQSVCSAVVD